MPADAVPASAASDATLLAATATGDTKAFATFMRRHQAPLARYLTLFSGSPDVDDAVQDTFIAVWRAASGFRGESSARAWLYAIARHAVHHQRRLRVDEPAEMESLDVLAERAGWGSLPDASLQQFDDDRRELLQRALARLPQDEREVLTLRELDGFSGEETAAAMHVSLAAMKSRLHRARIHLAAIARELLAAERRGPDRAAIGISGEAS